MEKLNDFSLFDMSASVLGSFLGGFTYPWQALDKLNAEICRIIPLLGSDYIELKTGVLAHKTAEIYPSALILPPAVICESAVIRHSAFIRGSAVIGRGAVVGNSTEIKNAVLFDGAKAPHFNYVGDSIVGKNAHLSAGVITCNVRADEMPVKVVLNGKSYDTGRKKVGSFIGDNAEIGCGSALNPGSVIGRRSRIYPLSSVRGEIFEDCIYKSCSEIVKIVIPDGRGSYDEVFRYGRFSGENGGEN